MGRVLVVDDDPDIRDILRLQLEVDGWIVEEAKDGSDGLAAAQRGGFDIIVLDQRMPRMTGEEMARELRRGGDRTPLVLVTADRTAPAIAARIGLRHWLVKPFDMADELLQLVRRFSAPVSRQ